MSEEIKEIIDKLSNRKQETLINGLRECQLKDIEHPFITREEYIDKILDYITNLQKENKILKENAEHNDKVVDKARWNEMIYKSRCEKAIELYKNCKEEDYCILSLNMYEALKGSYENE